MMESVPNFSLRERQCIAFAAMGYTDLQAERSFGCSARTIQTYWRRMFLRTGCQSRTEIVAAAIHYGVVTVGNSTD